MKIIANANKKGGVAKTTVSIHLSAYLAMLGYKVLIIDYDPQCSLSDGYGIDYENYPYTTHDFMQGNKGLRFKKKMDNLYIMVGSPLLDTVQYMDMYILRNRIETLVKYCGEKMDIDFDFVILDISPSDLLNKYMYSSSGKKTFLPKLNQIALAAADYAIIPLVTDRFSVKGLQGFIRDVKKLKKEYNNKLDIAGVFFNRVNVIEIDFRKFYKNVKEQIPEKYFIEHFVRRDSAVSRAVDNGESIFKTAPNSRAAQDFKEVCEQILSNINK